MSPADGTTVRGFLADGDTGAGLGGLRVELWSANGAGPSLVAASRSDEAGLFRLRLTSRRLHGKLDDGALHVEVRVLDGRRLVLSEVREVSLGHRVPTLELSVPVSTMAAEGASDEPDTADDDEVSGPVRGPVQEW